MRTHSCPAPAAASPQPGPGQRASRCHRPSSATTGLQHATRGTRPGCTLYTHGLAQRSIPQLAHRVHIEEASHTPTRTRRNSARLVLVARRSRSTLDARVTCRVQAFRGCANPMRDATHTLHLYLYTYYLHTYTYTHTHSAHNQTPRYRTPHTAHSPLSPMHTHTYATRSLRAHARPQQPTANSARSASALAGASARPGR